MLVTLRLCGERDGSSCEVTGYTLAQLRSNSCEYLRSFLDFGAACADDGENAGTTAETVTVFDVHTGSCRATQAAAALHFLLRGAAEAPLEVDGSNAAELLSLADLWCLDRVKAHVVACLRRSLCNGFRRPSAGSIAVEAVPQVAVLVRQALDYGIGDADGGLQRMYDECTAWMAMWAARAWPTRTFASLQRAIHDDVLAAARAHLSVETAPAVLSACRQLSGMPSVAWARRIEEMRADLTSYTLSYIWGNFPEICARAGLRQDRSECWGALLEELRNHVAENPDPEAAVRVLPRWAGITRALLYGAPPPAVAAALARRRSAAAAGAAGAMGATEDGASWLGEDEASQMQDLYDIVRNYCVRHLPLVARCEGFRSLPPAEQQAVLLIAQEGICCVNGFAAAAAAAAAAPSAAADLLQPLLPQQALKVSWSVPAERDGGGATAGGPGSASWVISWASVKSPPIPAHRPRHPGGQTEPAVERAGDGRQPSPAQRSPRAPAAVTSPPPAQRHLVASTAVASPAPARSAARKRGQVVPADAAVALVGQPLRRGGEKAEAAGPSGQETAAAAEPAAKHGQTSGVRHAGSLLLPPDAAAAAAVGCVDGALAAAAAARKAASRSSASISSCGSIGTGDSTPDRGTETQLAPAEAEAEAEGAVAASEAASCAGAMAAAVLSAWCEAGTRAKKEEADPRAVGRGAAVGTEAATGAAGRGSGEAEAAGSRAQGGAMSSPPASPALGEAGGGAAVEPALATGAGGDGAEEGGASAALVGRLDASIAASSCAAAGAEAMEARSQVGAGVGAGAACVEVGNDAPPAAEPAAPAAAGCALLAEGKPLLVSREHSADDFDGAVAAAADVDGGVDGSPRNAGASTQPSTPVRREADGPVGCRPKPIGGGRSDSDAGAAVNGEGEGEGGCSSGVASDAQASSAAAAAEERCLDVGAAADKVQAGTGACSVGTDAAGGQLEGPAASCLFQPVAQCDDDTAAAAAAARSAAAAAESATSVVSRACGGGSRGRTPTAGAGGGRPASASTTKRAPTAAPAAAASSPLRSGSGRAAPGSNSLTRSAAAAVTAAASSSSSAVAAAAVRASTGASNRGGDGFGAKPAAARLVSPGTPAASRAASKPAAREAGSAGDGATAGVAEGSPTAASRRATLTLSRQGATPAAAAAAASGSSRVTSARTASSSAAATMPTTATAAATNTSKGVDILRHHQASRRVITSAGSPVASRAAAHAGAAHAAPPAAPPSPTPDGGACGGSGSGGAGSRAATPRPASANAGPRLERSGSGGTPAKPLLSPRSQSRYLQQQQQQQQEQEQHRPDGPKAAAKAAAASAGVPRFAAPTAATAARRRESLAPAAAAVAVAAAAEAAPAKPRFSTSRK